MKRAVLLVLVLTSGSFAGCLAGDEDSRVQVQLTDEQIDAILEDYFQDFVNNTTVTINDQTNSNTTTNVYQNTSTNVYQNGTLTDQNGTTTYQNGTTSSQVEYFVIDYQFTKGDLVGVGDEIDYMNNTFVAIQSNSNYSTGEYTLSCEGYYLVGMPTTPVPYWQLNNTNYYWSAWTSEYNISIAYLYRDYAYNTDVRSTCDPSYATNGNNSERMTIYELEVPAGKALNCLTTPDLRMFHPTLEYYHPYIWGELRFTAPPTSSVSLPWRYSIIGQQALNQTWDDWSSPNCVQFFYGTPDRATTFSFTIPNNYVDYGFDYRFYMVYTLTDVSAHVP